MEKFIKPSDREYVRLAMLKHEETFKEQVVILIAISLGIYPQATFMVSLKMKLQVHELHRLYRIQKLMMRNIKKTKHMEHSQERRNFIGGASLTHTSHHSESTYRSERRFDLQQPSHEFIAVADYGSTGNGVAEHIDEAEIELTLGPSSYLKQKKMETTRTSDSGPSFSSSSTGSSDLTKKYLQTQQFTGRTQEELSIAQVRDLSLVFQGKGKSHVVDIGERLRQEKRKQSPWVFEVLSLNIT